MAPSFAVLAATFLIPFSFMLIEISLTRIFSITLWYHFGFLSITTAMAGFALGGIGAMRCVHFVQMGRWQREKPRAGFSAGEAVPAHPPRSFLGWTTLLYAMTILLMLLVVSKISLRHLTSGLSGLPWALSLYLSLLVPFFCAGLFLSLVLSWFPSHTLLLYSLDLLGTGIAAVIVLPLLGIVGAPGVCLAAAALAGVASFLLLNEGGRPAAQKKASFVLPLLAFLLPLVLLPFPFSLTLPKDKALSYYLSHQARIVFSQWNPLSRVDAFSPLPQSAWGLPEKFQPLVPDQIGVTIDGDGFTPIFQWNGKIGSLPVLQHLPSGLAYQAAGRNASVLLIGSGGGIDVLVALWHGAKKITAVEINPTIVNLVKKSYAPFSGLLFSRPGVTLYEDEGRHFLSHSKEAYSLIQLPLVDSWAATYSGSYALSENYLYTVEAVRDYWNHLQADGLLSMSRWESAAPLQTMRLLATITAAAGKNLQEHTAVISSGRHVTLLVKKSPLTGEETKRIINFAKQNGFEFLYLPPHHGETSPPHIPKEGLPGVLSPIAEDHASLYPSLLDPGKSRLLLPLLPYDLSPPPDDRPFFYQHYRSGEAWNALLTFLSGRGIPAVFQVLFLITAISGVSLLILLIPTAASRMPWRWGGYFACLGTGFMLIEVSLMEKWMVFLGHPVYAISLLLFSLLVGAGAGSYLGGLLMGRLSPGRSFQERLLPTILLLIAFLNTLLAFLIPPKIGMSSPFLLKALLVIVMVVPQALLMGIPFPAGLKIIGTSGHVEDLEDPGDLEDLADLEDPAAGGATKGGAAEDGGGRSPQMGGGSLPAEKPVSEPAASQGPGRDSAAQPEPSSPEPWQLAQWAWSVNGAFSVIGSSFSIFLAMMVGFRAVMLIGGGFYLLALIFYSFTTSRSS